MNNTGQNSVKSNIETWAIILSAGKGKRMNLDICKQYYIVKDKPILYYTLNAFEKSKIDKIVLVVGENEEKYVYENIVVPYNFKKIAKIVTGGEERFNSVYNGLMEIKDEGKVLIHDGARPLILPEDINNIIEQLNENNAVIMGVKAKDTIKITDKSNIVVDTPDRNYMWQIQTPQGFDCKKIKEAYRVMISKGEAFPTDDSMVMEMYGEDKIYMYEGKYSNIKITTPEDIIIMESLLEKNLFYNTLIEYM